MQLLLFGLAVEPGPLSAVALRGLEDGTPLLLGVECALHACHGGVPILVRSLRGAALSRSASSSRGWCRWQTPWYGRRGGGCACSPCAPGGAVCWPSGARSCRFQ